MRLKYIYHSSFLVELKNVNIIFDYYKKEIPDMDRNKKLYIISTHGHKDHFNKKIFDLFSEFKDVEYILSDDINLINIEKDKNIHKISINSKYNIGDLEIETFESTDLGVAVLIKVEGKTIYHAGDLNWWTWHGYETKEEYQVMTERFLKEMDKLTERNIDLAMVPLDPRQGNRYDWGLSHFIKVTKTSYVAPMHLWEKYEMIDKFRKKHLDLTEKTVIIDTHKTSTDGYTIE